MHGRHCDETGFPSEVATRRRAGLFQGLIGVAERIHAERDVDAVLRVATEGARDLLGARRAATSVVLDSKHPRPIHLVANRDGPPQEWTSPDADGPAFSAALAEADGPIRPTEAGLGAE